MNQLNHQITVTMAELEISKSELSRRIGKSRGYLAQMQKVGCSTEKQAELIAKIQMVADGSSYKSDEAIISELKNKLEESKEWASHNFKCANRLEKELAELKDYIEDQERHHKEIREWNTEVDITNKELRKNAQERAERIENLEMLFGITDSENDKLRETVRKQAVLIEQANDNAMRVPTTAMAAFILFIKMIFGGKA